MSSDAAAKAPWLEVCCAALPAALHAVVWLGRLHPDELFQSLEVALREGTLDPALGQDEAELARTEATRIGVHFERDGQGGRAHFPPG